MSKVLNRWAALAVSTVVGTAVLTPLGGVAHAVTGTQIQYYVASKNGGPPALYTSATTPDTQVSSSNVKVLDLRASQDGTRFVDVEAFIDSSGNQVERVMVYDISGHALGTVASEASFKGSLAGPALSPDGSVAAWTRMESGVATLFTKDLTSGLVTNLGTGRYHPLFVGPTTLLVRDADERGYWMPASGGAPTQISPFPSDFPDQAVGMTVSPDGHTVAWEGELGTTPSTADIVVAPLTVDSNGVSLGPATGWTHIATGQDNYAPAFSRDGQSVLFVHADNGSTGFGQVMTVPVTGGTPTASSDDLGTVVTQAVGEIPPAPVTPLAQPNPLPAVLGGTAATLRWTNPADDRVSQVLVRRFAGTKLLRSIYVPLPTSSFRDTGLTIGTRYTYTLTSLDRAGHPAANPPGFDLVAAGAQPTYADPTSRVYTHSPFAVRFGPGSPAVLWTVDYRVNNSGSWRRWVTDVTTSVRTFTAGVPGATYQFRARATDGYSSTPLVNGVLTVVPTDQSKATLYGGTTVASSSAWAGSYRKLTRTTQYARISLYGNRLQVIAWRCAGCGSFAIYQGSVKIATVSTYASSTKVRDVVFTKYWSTNATRTFTIKPLGTSGHPAVLLDAFAMRR